MAHKVLQSKTRGGNSQSTRWIAGEILEIDRPNVRVRGQFRMPHTKSIDGGLFELRVKGKEGIAMVFFCAKIGKKIIMLHSFVKKSQKTPKKELRIAKSRMSEVTNDVTF